MTNIREKASVALRLRLRFFENHQVKEETP
jgi:hypothetical protein